MKANELPENAVEHWHFLYEELLADTQSVAYFDGLDAERLIDRQEVAALLSFTNSASVLSQDTVTTSITPNGSANIGVVFMPLQYPQSPGVSSFTFKATMISLNTATLRDTLNGATDQSVIYVPSTFPAYGRAWG